MLRARAAARAAAAVALQLLLLGGPHGAAQKPAPEHRDAAAASSGPYVDVERMDMRRVLIRVAVGAPLPPADEEVMLDQLEQWKWRVEMAAAGAAVLVTSSQCPHGLGLIPQTLGWRGGGIWRIWPGTFERAAGSLVAAGGQLEEGDFSFLDAKRHCQQLDLCGGFSFAGTWPDSEQMTGVTRRVLFSSERAARAPSGGQKWTSYVLRDNPRATCNPEGQAFECPANPYACLGLSIDADDSAIKQAYRSLGKRLHPDKLGKAGRSKEAVRRAEEAFRDISESHEALRDPQRRRDADRRLRKERKRWEEQRASVQDIYIKEPMVASLEPEMYPVLIHFGREWLVHFFLPSNDDCKQMKIAFGRVAGELGTGEEEHASVVRGAPSGDKQLSEGSVFRGVIREKSVALRSPGAGVAEGDMHVALVILPNMRAKLFALGEELEFKMSVAEDERRRRRVTFEGAERTFVGTFDDSQWLRGTIADAPRRDHEVASFAVQRDNWQQPPVVTESGTSRRLKPRLFGAVNCGRFPDFCKRKGIDPAIERRFPQVRMLFPEEVRFELYRGRPLAREVSAFAREASRTPGGVRALGAASVMELQAAAPSQWLALLLREPGGRASLDCTLCRSALPALRRAAPRFAAAGVHVGWANCTAEAATCAVLAGQDPEEGSGRSPEEGGAEWGALRLLEFGGPSAGAGGGPLAPPSRSQALWDQRLVVGEAGQAALVAALEAAAAMAGLLGGGRPDAPQAGKAPAQEL